MKLKAPSGPQGSLECVCVCVNADPVRPRRPHIESAGQAEAVTGKTGVGQYIERAQGLLNSGVDIEMYANEEVIEDANAEDDELNTEDFEELYKESGIAFGVCSCLFVSGPSVISRLWLGLGLACFAAWCLASYLWSFSDTSPGQLRPIVVGCQQLLVRLSSVPGIFWCTTVCVCT